jgi:hypothetical protein
VPARKLERVVAKNPLLGEREEIFDDEVVKNRSRRLGKCRERDPRAGWGTPSPGVPDPEVREVQGKSIRRSAAVRCAGTGFTDPAPYAFCRLSKSINHHSGITSL